MATKRLRIFAGPNGSGKSSIHKTLVEAGDINLGIFVNADEIEKQLKNALRLDFSNYSIVLDFEDFRKRYKAHRLYESSKGDEIMADLGEDLNSLVIAKNDNINSHFAAIIADYIRVKMLDSVNVFTIETVMSHPSKVDYIELAKSKGYRVYLYFVSTSDVRINESRVLQRVDEGGHPVPPEKIRERYTRSMDIMFDAIKACHRAYIFDNSEKNAPKWYAEYDGKHIEFKYKTIPLWMDTYLIKKIEQ